MVWLDNSMGITTLFYLIDLLVDGLIFLIQPVNNHPYLCLVLKLLSTQVQRIFFDITDGVYA